MSQPDPYGQSDPYRRQQPRSSLVRPQDRWIAGVCSGLGRRFGLEPSTVRILFVVSCLLPGPQFLLYIALWVLMPSE